MRLDLDPTFDPATAALRRYAERLYAVRAVLGEAPVLVGPSAAWAHGCEVAWDDDPVHVNVDSPHGLDHRDGVRVHQSRLSRSDVVLTRFGRTTSLRRTALDLACTGPRSLALGRLDALARARPLPLPALVGDAYAARGRRGIRQARELLPLVDGRAESPRESMLRLAVHDAGLPHPTPQLEVRDSRGRFVARLDLGWEEERVGLEYDGAAWPGSWPGTRGHLDADVHRRDLRRHNDLREEGWVVFQVDAAGYRVIDRVLGAVAGALHTRRAGAASRDTPGPAVTEVHLGGRGAATSSPR